MDGRAVYEMAVSLSAVDERAGANEDAEEFVEIRSEAMSFLGRDFPVFPRNFRKNYPFSFNTVLERLVGDTYWEFGPFGVCAVPYGDDERKHI